MGECANNFVQTKLSFEEKLPNQKIKILQDNDVSLNGSTYTKKISEIEQLQEQVLNSLNYASNKNILPSTLPEQLNIKFLNVSTLDRLKDRFLGSPVAQLEDPNTMYVSTALLPQNQQNSRSSLISKLYDKFKNPQQVLDLVIFHELGHLVFNNSFTDFTQFNSELLKTRNGVERFKFWFKEDYKDLPLYQINRSLEEHFADSFSAIILAKRYGTLLEDYVKIRNGSDSLGLTRTKGFNININRLNDNFKQLSKVDYEKDGIDIVVKQLYEISLASSKGVMSDYFKLARDNIVLNRLKFNLNSLGIDTTNDKNSILDNAENIIKSKLENTNNSKTLVDIRMFSISNVSDGLDVLNNTTNGNAKKLKR